MPTHYHYPKAPPIEPTFELIEGALQELENSRRFLDCAIENPLLLFQQADTELGSERNIITTVMNVPTLKNEEATSPLFLVYLATLLDKAFKEWAKTQIWKHEVAVLVRQPNSFPSIFAVYVDEREVLQFNIFKKWYGIRGKTYTEDELIEQYNRSEKNARKEISKIEKKLAHWNELKAKPWKFIKTHKDVIALLFKRKSIDENCTRRIASLERQIEHINQDLLVQKENIAETLERQEKARQVSDKMRIFFEEQNYTLNEQQHQLY